MDLEGFEAEDENQENEDFQQEIFDMEKDIFGEEDTLNDEYKSKKDCVIFLVDCRKTMFNQQQNKQMNQFEEVMSALQGFLKQKIIASDNDKIGLVFYNTKYAKNTLDVAGVNIVQELDIPSSNFIKNCQEYVKKYDNDYGFADKEISLNSALWVCNFELKKQGDASNLTKRIFLFTNEDNPCHNKPQERQQTIQQAQNIADQNINIELFPLPKPNNEIFDVKKFFIEICTYDQDEINSNLLDTSTDRMKDLTSRLKAKSFKKRRLGRVFFDLGTDFRIGVAFYCMINKAKKPLSKTIHAKSNKILKTTTDFICKDTGSTLYPNQIGTCVLMGKEKIPIKKEEMEKIKKFDSPSLQLVGFKNDTKLKPYHNVSNSYFIYPDDEHVENSSQVFDSLIKQMIKKKKIAIVKFVPRVTASVRFCALVPQEESYDQQNFQTPPGFNLIFLPFADDMRKPDTVIPENSKEATKEQIVHAKLLVNCLTQSEVQCKDINNPVLQKFFSYLQAVALDQENPEKIEDNLQPDEEGMLNQYADVIEIFKKSVYDQQMEEDNQKKKRGGGGARGARGAAAARTKSEKMEVEDEEQQKSSRRGRGSRSGGGARGGGRGTGRGAGGRGKSTKVEVESDGSNLDADNDYDFDDDFIVDDRKQKKQRGGVGMGGGSSGKNKFQSSDEEYNDEENEEEQVTIISKVDQQLREGEFPKSLTVKQLKIYCNYAGISQQGSRTALIDRCLKYLSENN